MSHHHDEEEFEPVPGLPEELPEGEYIIWQGAPSAPAIARRIYHWRMITAYFVGLLAFEAGSDIYAGVPFMGALANAGPVLLPASLLLGLIALLTWQTASTTLYTLTNKRLVMRVGMALSKNINLPFSAIEKADAKVHEDGTLDLILTPDSNSRIAYLALWPHAKPFRLRRARPMLRSVPQGAKVARLFADALARFHGTKPAIVTDKSAGLDQGQMGDAVAHAS